jgi:hypothetical protein
MSHCVPITATSSIAGFASGGSDHYFNYGISDKDQGYQATVDAGERTRDILGGQRISDGVNYHGHTATQVAVEKTGAANVLAAYQTTGLLQVQAERIRAESALQMERARTELSEQASRYHIANTMAMSDMRLEQQKQACEIEAKIAACCCDIKETVRQIESDRIRDDLAQCRAELLASARGHGSGN